jgi:hypothetical protein
VIDAFAGLIIGWEYSTSKHTTFVERAITRAAVFRARQGNPLQNKTIHHSAAGSPNTLRFLTGWVSEGRTSAVVVTGLRPGRTCVRAVVMSWVGTGFDLADPDRVSAGVGEDLDVSAVLVLFAGVPRVVSAVRWCGGAGGCDESAVRAQMRSLLVHGWSSTSCGSGACAAITSIASCWYRWPVAMLSAASRARVRRSVVSLNQARRHDCLHERGRRPLSRPCRLLHPRRVSIARDNIVYCNPRARPRAE